MNRTKLKPSWLERPAKRFRRPEEVRRICRRCRERILRNHKWRLVRVFWFAPWYCCEHKDCDHPTLEAQRQPTKSPEPELPFEENCVENAV